MIPSSLPAPVAGRLLAPVNWADRFIATVNGHRGFSKLPVYSVEELLRVAEQGAVVVSGPALATWLEEVIGDCDLAEEVRAATLDAPLFGQAAIVFPLIRDRYEQARALVVETPAGA